MGKTMIDKTHEPVTIQFGEFTRNPFRPLEGEAAAALERFVADGLRDGKTLVLQPGLAAEHRVTISELVIDGKVERVVRGY